MISLPSSFLLLCSTFPNFLNQGSLPALPCSTGSNGSPGFKRKEEGLDFCFSVTMRKKKRKENLDYREFIVDRETERRDGVRIMELEVELTVQKEVRGSSIGGGGLCFAVAALSSLFCIAR
ncbi:hypothetical protein VNO77_13651 [Canavalia gladiata]|uniref:Uncharacterized protein n=1 Tax=Canavalia gladiata TaxID=3824 RepID=A0AAN9QV30_CANGL